VLISVLGVANLGLFIQITFFCAIKSILPLFRAFIAAFAARVARLFFLHSVFRKNRVCLCLRISGKFRTGFQGTKNMSEIF